MTESSSNSGSLRPLDTATRLAVDRTRLAYDRTLMAWIRTATSLITFGFTIYKFFQFETARRETAVEGWMTPRGAGMVLIGAGLTALVLGVIEHRVAFKRMNAEFSGVPPSSAGVIAAIVCLMGIAAFAAALFQI